MAGGRRDHRRKKKHHHKTRIDLSSPLSHIIRWATLYTHHSPATDDSPTSSLSQWLPSSTAPSFSSSSLVVDLHTHSTCSDGMLSPVQLVERAVARGVQVLALTDHDTMAGIPKALEAANKYRIRLIPGVEISAQVTSSMKSGVEEPVHILAYYSCCGPMRWQELERALARVREGRHHRAQVMVDKLRSLKKPVKWERVLALAGSGVAPGRMHIARALVEAGHVSNLKEAFNKYLHDGGPAYAPGYEMAAEDAIRLICDTGGIAALAHPWSLKDPLMVVKRLKDAGLHGIEVYRGDGKVNGFAAVAESYGLLKLGGSDFHGRGDPDEVKLGQTSLNPVTIHNFLQAAEPIWLSSIKELLRNFSEEIFEINSDKVVGVKYFSEDEILKGDISLGYATEGGELKPVLKLSPWLTEMERVSVKDDVVQLKLNLREEESQDGKVIYVISQQN